MSEANLDNGTLSGFSRHIKPTDRLVLDGRKLELYHDSCCFLTLKNPNNNLTKEELLRVLYSLRDIIGFSCFYYIWYETGSQSQQHLHTIIKKSYKTLTQDNIKKWSKSFKLKKCKYLLYGHGQFESELGSLLEYEIDTRCCNWKITPIADQLHLNTLIYEYQFKELGSEFID